MNQLAVIDNHANVEAYRASTNAASMCKEFVAKTATRISGKRYVTVEGWQAVAIAHGCTASADQVERVHDEGASGFKCTGIVRRMSDGAEIARAEGFLGDDEPTWAKRPVYARRAMVQTRAISRACRSAFAHVVLMMDAGLETTPAEEVPFEDFDRETGEILDAKPLSSGPPPRTKLDGPHTSKTALRTAVCDIIAKVRAAQTADEISAIVKESKPTVDQAKKDWPELIDGEPNIEEDGGLRGALATRKAELAEIENNAVVSGLIESMRSCETSLSLANWRAANEGVIDALDGAEGRKFELAWNLHESAVKEMEKVSS